MSKLTLRELVDQALADKKLTRLEQQQIMDAITEDHQVSAEEHAILEEIMDLIAAGDVTVIE